MKQQQASGTDASDDDDDIQPAGPVNRHGCPFVALRQCSKVQNAFLQALHIEVTRSVPPVNVTVIVPCIPQQL